MHTGAWATAAEYTSAAAAIAQRGAHASRAATLPHMRLEGKIALVTGGASGIGAATARRLAAEGARVAIADLNEEGGRAVAAELDGHAVPHGRHRHRLGQRRRRGRSSEALGPIDVLVNNAGTDLFSFFVKTDPGLWDFVLGVNLRGTLAVTHAVLPGMQERRCGAIVNVASEAGRVGSQGSAVYSAAKAGVIGFTKAIAREAARYRVRVNAVAPGPIETPLLERRAHRLRRGRRAPQAGHGRRHPARARRRARGGRRRHRLPRLRGRLLRHRPDAQRQRRPLDVVSCACPQAVSIREVGPRDGFQNEPEVIPTARKIELIDALARTGLQRIGGHELRARRRHSPARRRRRRCWRGSTCPTGSR